MPADQVGAPLEQDLGHVNACSPWSSWKGGRGWGTVHGNYKGTAGRDAPGPNLPPPKGASRGWGVGGFTGGSRRVQKKRLGLPYPKPLPSADGEEGDGHRDAGLRHSRGRIGAGIYID